MGVLPLLLHPGVEGPVQTFRTKVTNLPPLGPCDEVGGGAGSNLPDLGLGQASLGTCASKLSLL